MRKLVLLLPLLLLALAQSPRTHYVSRGGDNTDGASWNTAWNELDQIRWDLIEPGDTILVDGGSVACPPLGDEPAGCGMVYNTRLSFGKDGVTVRLGTPGTAIFDGNQTRFTYCAENAPMATPPSQPSGSVLGVVVSFNGRSGAELDGTRWGGIVVRNGTQGIHLGGGDGNRVRYVKVHHHNNPNDTTNNSIGIQHGWTADGVTLSRVEIYRNGQDAVRVAGDGFTLEDSYIHDHYCNHPDGVQALVFTANADVPDDAGEIRDLTIRNNVFERVGLQNVFLGENAGHQSWVNGAQLTGNLFLSSKYVLKSKHGRTTNFVFSGNTVIGSTEFGIEWCCASPGAQAPMLVRDNIFVRVRNPAGTGFYVPTGGGPTQFTGNCLWQSGGFAGGAFVTGSVTLDPQFAGGSWALQPGSPCAGKGSSLGSVRDLAGLMPAATPTATRTATPTETATPTPTSSPTPTETATPACLRLSDGFVCFVPFTPTP